MDRREHPRIQIPLLVELSHPAVGSLQTTVRDASEGGLFIFLPDAKIHKGAKVKLRVLSIIPGDPQPTPTVEMNVVRHSDTGLGLSFINKTSRHLWESARRLRSELTIGEDYFQVHQSVAVTHADKGVLLVLQSGRWLLPGSFLLVGTPANQAASDLVKEQLSLTVQASKITALAVTASVDERISEAATFMVALRANIEAHDISLAKGSSYKDWRWVLNDRDLQELTIVDDWQREIVQGLIGEMDQA